MRYHQENEPLVSTQKYICYNIFANIVILMSFYILSLLDIMEDLS